MHTLTSRLLMALTAASIAMLGMAQVDASADSAESGARIMQAHPERSCAGESATLAWTRPADVPGLTGYEIVHHLTTPAGPRFSTTTAGPDRTAIDFEIPFGLSIFQIYAISPAGPAPSPFTSASVMGNKAPSAMQWDLAGSTVGDRTATTSYKWYGPPTWSTTGGLLPAMVRVTASPGGAEIEGPAGQFTQTFAGLKNGVDYTFRAVTFNACGASGPGTSPTFTPGVAPVWTRNTPPLRTGAGEYVYNFSATGDPVPTFQLADAPAWLQISPKGLVSGRPPSGTDAFSYSVVARSRVGIHPFDRTDFVVGPFAVSVWSP